MVLQNNNQIRSRIIQGIFIIIFTVIIVQLINLQLFSSKYRIQAESNAILRKVVYPDRGIIYDRKGRAMLGNIVNYDLVVTPYNTHKSVDTLSLCNILGIDSIEYNKRMAAIVAKNGSFKESTFEPLLSPQLYAQLNENLYKFPGFALQERPLRVYPYHVGANFLGRMSEVSSEYLKNNSGTGYQSGDYIGITGLEKSYENVLMGQRGVQRFLRDNRARIEGPYNNGNFDTVAIAGRNLYTSIDVDVQALGEKMFQGKLGAAVAINPKTGGVIAMVTAPSFDPNDLTPAEYKSHIKFLTTDTTRPLYNRAIAGMYPPGSTYKPMGALIALSEGIISPAYGYACYGAYYGCGGHVVRCDEHWAGHADNLKLAIANSCNSYFCNVFRMTIDNPKYGSPRKGYAAWRNYMQGFGMGKTLGVDVPGEREGNIPDTAVYNKEYGNRWVACNLITMGIGQDKLTLTPLHSANEACIIANKGWYYTPHLVDSIERETDDDSIYFSKYRVKHQPLNISDEDYRTVQHGMEDVAEVGTAKNVTIPGIKYAAKTGTAQVPKVKNLAVFIAYAPVENPKIAIAVYVENAGYGATWAAPIAAHMMELYLNDSLTQASKDDVERLSKIDLMPSQVYEWRKKQDIANARKMREQAAKADTAAKVQEQNKTNSDTGIQKNKNRQQQSSDVVRGQAQAILSDKKIKKTSKR